jgi:hypothetical protein
MVSYDWLTLSKTIALSQSHTHNFKISCFPTKNNQLHGEKTDLKKSRALRAKIRKILR